MTKDFNLCFTSSKGSGLNPMLVPSMRTQREQGVSLKDFQTPQAPRKVVWQKTF